MALAVALRALVLLDIIEQDFTAAVDTSVIEIETKAANFERFATTFVLAGVDSGIELLEDLVVAGEQSAIEYFGVAQIDCWLEGFRGDDDALPVR